MFSGAGLLLWLFSLRFGIRGYLGGPSDEFPIRGFRGYGYIQLPDLETVENKMNRSSSFRIGSASYLDEVSATTEDGLPSGSSPLIRG